MSEEPHFSKTPIARKKTYAAQNKPIQKTPIHRQKTSQVITNAIQSIVSLPYLISKFREIEGALISNYIEDIKVQFVFACATSDKLQTDDEQSLPVESFVEYGLSKKIRFQP
jgi:hypothetical protein